MCVCLVCVFVYLCDGYGVLVCFRSEMSRSYCSTWSCMLPTFEETASSMHCVAMSQSHPPAPPQPRHPPSGLPPRLALQHLPLLLPFQPAQASSR